MKAKIGIIIFLGLVVRIWLSATTMHPDLRGHNFAGYLIAQKGELLTFYDHISRLPRTDAIVKLYGDDLFIYPPLAYQVHGLFNFLLYPFYPQQLFQEFLIDMGRVAGNPQLPQLLFLLKAPYFVADLLFLVLLLKIVPPKKKVVSTLLWAGNIVTLHSAFMMGQFDIYISVFLLVAYVLSSSGKNALAAIVLGIAANFKPFPLFLLPFLPGKKVLNIGIGVGAYLLMILPYISSTGFRQYALFAPQTDKLSYAKIMVSGSQYLPLFFVGLVLLFWWNYFKKQALPLWGWFLAVPLLFYSVSHYHPQWFMWGMPFLLLAVIYDRTLRFPAAILTACYVGIVLLFEPSINFGLFHINFDLSKWMVGKYPPDQFASLIRGVFAATATGLVAKATAFDTHSSK